MRFGIQINNFTPGPDGGNEWDSVVAQARAAEAAGFDSVWLYDHFMWVRGDPESPDYAPVLECYTGLGGLAVATNRVKLGSLVAGVPYRNPALHAKIVSTLDVMSHGRAIFGVGAAWAKHEFDAFGWDFPDVPTRMRGLREALEIATRMFTQRPATYRGQIYRIEGALNDPSGIQKPRIPILVGGGGEKTTLRLAARYGDYCNVFGEPEQVRHKFEVLRQHCQDVGRPYDEVIRTNFLWIALGRTESDVARMRERFEGSRPRFAHLFATPDQLIERLREYAAAGSQQTLLQMPDAHELDSIRLFGETVIPALADV